MFDFRYAIRSLSRARGFAVAVVVTLGLGIGANTAVFSVVRGVLLKPLPHRDGDRLMYLRQSTEGPGGENVLFSVPEIEDFRTSSTKLAGIAEYSPMTFSLLGDDDAVRIDVGLVTGNYFEVMGLAPVLGRSFDQRDDGTGAEPVMMLTHDYWMERFGGDSAIVGTSVIAGGRAVQVVGVLQPAPYFPGRIDALMNMVNSEHHLSAMMVTGRTHRMTEMIARLAPGATVAEARAEIEGITARVHREYPEAYDAGSRYRVTVTPFQEVLGQDARLTLWLLMAAAAFVLVIACANVANLTLMRGVRREHELTVRASLGAGTTRLRRLLLAENLVLAGLGGALGLLLAFAGVGMLTTFAERYSPRASEIRVDGAVLAFTSALVLMVAVLLSYAPKLASESNIGALIAAGGRRTTAGSRRQRLQQALVVAQIAVSVMLLTGAGLLTRTMQRLSMVDAGLDTENVLTMEVPIDFGAETTELAVSRYQQMQGEIAALPGVRQVAFGSTIPLRSAGFMLEIKAEGRPVAPGEPMPRAEYRTTGPDYFSAAGIPLLRGRDFAATDRQGGAPVVILNETLANRLFPGEDPIGRRVAWTGSVLEFIPVSGDWRTVVGVVGDTKDGGLDAAPLPAMFMPFVQEAFPSGGLVIRSRGDAARLAPEATRIVRSIAPQQPIENVLTLDQIRDESVGPRRLNAMLVGSFGLLALIVAAIGIAAVLAFSVSARTNEIGIRMSIGADSGMVQRMILSEGGLLVMLGLVIGAVGALSLSRLMQGLLFGVEPHDPMTLATVAFIMAAVGIFACWIPALRAARIDPGVALRAQ
ncbi:MAG TPA: ABC transporter permease [Longimicrobiales bacterium]|nr:ABC transporter permease [Longimicrobiales bacterium]